MSAFFLNLHVLNTCLTEKTKSIKQYISFNPVIPVIPLQMLVVLIILLCVYINLDANDLPIISKAKLTKLTSVMQLIFYIKVFALNMLNNVSSALP